MATLHCLIFTAREWTGERSGKTLVWAQVPNSIRAWYFPVPLPKDSRDDIEKLPPSVMVRFRELPRAHDRSPDVFAIRLGTAQMDEEELERDWIAATPPLVVFREPKDEDHWDGIESHLPKRRLY